MSEPIGTLLERPTRLKSLCAVVPRFGPHLGGGAEALVRSLLLKIQSNEFNDLLQVDHLEVWTTCAIDHRTWINELPQGSTFEDGLLVRRFRVEGIDVDPFLHAEIAMRDGFPLTSAEQIRWLDSGVNSRSLYQHIVLHASEFDALLFAPYLFPTTFWGALLCYERAILIPCLHNEHYAYQPVMRHLFNRVRGLIFNAPPEQELAATLYGHQLSSKSAVVGMGFEPVNVPQIPLEFPFKREKPYLLYSGRKEEGKNLDLLISWFEKYQRNNSTIELLLIGSGEINFRKELPDGVFDLGFVSEEEKLSLMTHALSLCQLSLNESFSIVLMEAWLVGCPVIVHGKCPVTRHHVTESGGGLFVEAESDFFAAIELLLSSNDIRAQFARAGKQYVERVYSWPAVIGRLSHALQLIASRGVESSNLIAQSIASV